MAEQLANLAKSEDWILNRPDLWTANTEYDFGNGLYGMRVTGTTTNGNTALAQFPHLSKLVQWGGHINNSDIWFLTLGYFSTTSNYITVPWFFTTNGVSTIQIDYTPQYDGKPYDIWFTYRK